MISEGSNNQIVFVLGMHRSGTSLTAELVHGLGYAIPGEPLDAIDEVNARGFWESKNIVAFNERLLEAAKLKWFHVCPIGHFFKSIPEEVLHDISIEIKDFLSSEVKKHGRLVIKDPRLCILLPVWLPVIDRHTCDVKIIFINRHPASVAGSLQARDGFSLFSGHLLWMYYFFSVFCRGNSESILCLGYENMLSDPHTCGKILPFLGIAEVDGENWLKIIDVKLQRNFNMDFPDKGYVYNLAKYAHALFLHGAIVADSFDFSLCRNDFERFVFENNDFVYALNESNNNISALRNELVSIGGMHTHALSVIGEKDTFLQESAEKICEADAQILELTFSLDQCQKEAERLQKVVSDCDVYITECEARIFDLEFAMAEFSAVRARIADLERLIVQRNVEALRNEAYIARLDARILELHEAMKDFEALRERIAQIEEILKQKNIELGNRLKALAGAEERIVELDGLFVGQRTNYLSSLGVIDELERKLASRNDEFFSVVDELDEVKNRLESLLSWRVVRFIDRRASKGGSRDD